MPELPEVETIAKQLDRVLIGKKISRIEIKKQKSFQGDVDDLVGKTISGVERRAKMIVMRFRGVEKILMIHLKMTGQLIYIEDSKTQKTKNSKRVVGGHPTPDWVNELPNKHTRVLIDFSDGSKLFFNDLRIFGWMKIMQNSEFGNQMSKLPPDVTDKGFSLEYFSQVLGRSGRSVKLVLIDQSHFGGIGNIYANDALYKARIDPRRKAKELSKKEVSELYRAVKEVIDLGIKYGGASIDRYVNAVGLEGKYQEHFLVYGREGEKCERDGETIKKIKIGARGTYYCPTCQK